MNRLAVLVLAVLTMVLSCTKVPIHNVNAGFTLADGSWFEAEQTLFVFYEVHADQGLGEPSVIEIRYASDAERVDWTPVEDLVPVHRHVPVDCGPDSMCGSVSVHVPSQPRQFEIRLRYHRDGELALDTFSVFNVILAGNAHRKRSFLVYGVFDETNQLVQWRGRHMFPTMRNMDAERLGLRRKFTISEQAFGTDVLTRNNNPYGYGVTCPDTFAPTGFIDVSTDKRAVFNDDDLPLGASSASTVCAQSTVVDALGFFTAAAIAQKNPEVRPAFPVLRSPVRDATQLPFFLAPCDRRISKLHKDMQRQRLGLEGVPTTCTEGWQQQGWINDLVVDLRDAVEAERPNGEDMVLVIGLHQDEDGVAEAVEAALAQVVPDERLRGSPRLAGAFVFDSTIRGLGDPELSPVTLWCPSTIPLDEIPDASGRTCAIAPDNLDFELGPFSFGALPILTSRDQYLDFVDTYSVNQAGEMHSLTFRAPEFAPTAVHIGLGEIGAATFLNGEIIGADADDAFSYCLGEEPQLFVFRSPLIRSGQLDFYTCLYLGISEDICASAQFGLAPIETLPEWHNIFGEGTYEIGIVWEFPFLMRMEYQVAQAGAISAFGLSVPFGLAQDEQTYYGTELWTQDEFSLEQTMTQCTRFCDHPTFDSAGQYHVTDPFRSVYAATCYLPLYPMPGDSGFPLDF